MNKNDFLQTHVPLGRRKSFLRFTGYSLSDARLLEGSCEKPIFLRVQGLFWEALGVIWGQCWSTLSPKLVQEGQVGAKIRVLSAKRGHGGAKAY